MPPGRSRSRNRDETAAVKKNSAALTAPRTGGGGRVCSAPGRGAGRACARRDLPHVCAGGGAVTRCGRRGSIMVSAGAAAAPSPHRSFGPGPGPGLPRSARPAPRGRTPRRARRCLCSFPRFGRCRGPQAAAAAPPPGCSVPAAPAGSAGSREGRGEGGGGGLTASQGHAVRAAEATTPAGAGVAGQQAVAGGLRGLLLLADQTLELRIPPCRSNGSSPVATALQGRAAQATAGLCGNRKEAYATLPSSPINFIKFFIEKEESLTELPLILQ